MSDDPKNTSESWRPMGGGAPKQPKFVQEQAANMVKLRDLLEGILGQKQAEVVSLQEKLLRLKHGGGQ